MAIAYTQKLIIAGKSIELYQYSNKIFAGFERKGGFRKSEPTSRADFSISRTRNNLRRLIESNPQLNKFVTFTFSRDMFDISVANSHFTRFIQRLKHALYPKLKYLSVLEFQKDVDYHGKVKENGGSVHYHSLFDFPYTPQSELREIWGENNGTAWINRIYDPDGAAGYVSKYLEKESFDPKYHGKKKYFASRNLNRPIEIKNDLLVDEFLLKNEKFLRLKYACNFISEYAGKIRYRQFYNIAPNLPWINNFVKLS